MTQKTKRGVDGRPRRTAPVAVPRGGSTVEAVLGAVRGARGPVKVAQIAKRIRRSCSQARRTLAKLHEEGLIERVLLDPPSGGGGGRRPHGYRVP